MKKTSSWKYLLPVVVVMVLLVIAIINPSQSSDMEKKQAADVEKNFPLAKRGAILLFKNGDIGVIIYNPAPNATVSYCSHLGLVAEQMNAVLLKKFLAEVVLEEADPVRYKNFVEKFLKGQKSTE